MINNFWELARVVVPGAKAILTCRTEHFPNAREGRDLLNAELQASTANLTGDPPQFEVLQLEKFDQQQIEQALLKKTGQHQVDQILKHPELLDLASRPVMLDFILEALPEIESGKPVDLSRVYLYAITRKLDRDIKSERTFTSLADKLYFMCELSTEMLHKENMSINYRLFPSRLKNLFGQKIEEEKDLDHWHYDMMGNSLLIRNDDGDYSPAHRSLLEFFVAYKLVAELGFLPEDFVATARLQSYIDQSKAPQNYSWSNYFCLQEKENYNSKGIPPLKKFVTDEVDQTLTALGKVGEAVLRFVHEITNVEEVRIPFHRMLQKILNEFKHNKRDLEEQQEIAQFIYDFRIFSQEWEEQVDQSNTLRNLWKKHHHQETKQVKGLATPRTFYLERPGKVPLPIEMVQLPAGRFLGGGHSGKIHHALIPESFLVCTVPVTQELYERVVSKNPSHSQGENRPVEMVPWLDAVIFCNQLSSKMSFDSVYEINEKEVHQKLDSDGFRLLSKIEWEYACRAGTTSRYSSGDSESDLDQVGWYNGNSRGQTHPVKQKMKNTFGLYDLHGHIFEWLWDSRKYTDKIQLLNENSNMQGGYYGGTYDFCYSNTNWIGDSKRGAKFVGFRIAKNINRKNNTF